MNRVIDPILVTGAAGFIGSAFVRVLMDARPEVRVIVLDALTYAGNLENLEAVRRRPNFAFVRADVADRSAVEAAFAAHRPEAVVHFAAETHVDRSIMDGGPFVRSNVLGTQVLLDVSRAHGVRRYVQISTDEVYGSLGASGAFTEDTPLAPNSPYAASKAAADLTVRACHHTFGLSAMITRCSNNYGPYQFPEKLIPLMVSNALEEKALPVYGDGLNVRDWIHADDHARAVLAVLERGTAGAVYNIGAGCERTNIDLVRLILRIVGRPETLIRYVTDRPGHDRRYAIDAGRIRGELAWRPEVDFETGLAETVRWYVEHRAWWETIKSGAYREYYERLYGDR